MGCGGLEYCAASLLLPDAALEAAAGARSWGCPALPPITGAWSACCDG